MGSGSSWELDAQYLGLWVWSVRVEWVRAGQVGVEKSGGGGRRGEQAQGRGRTAGVYRQETTHFSVRLSWRLIDVRNYCSTMIDDR